uniref:Dihydroorotase n=1 Tax=Lygus hesperus TaxID=30085 RepID=A0A0A9W776_LYGHE
MFVEGCNPHYFCKPMLKSESDRVALLQAATSANPVFFAGSDSAPHVRRSKECDRGAAGCYTGFHTLQLYAEAFDSVGALHALPAFLSQFGATFYQLPQSSRGSVRLQNC